MPTFQSNPLNTSPVHRTLRRHPAWFGIPFLAIMIGASYGLQSFTQTRYELADQKVKQVRLLFFLRSCLVEWDDGLTLGNLQVNKEEELGLKKAKRKFDIREEYYVRSESSIEFMGLMPSSS